MACLIQLKAFICDIERLKNLLPIRDKYADMAVVGVRLPEPVEGVIDYAELKISAAACGCHN